MAGNHQVDVVGAQNGSNTNGISAGIAADVGHPHFYAFDFKLFDLVAASANIAVVDVSGYGSNYRRNLLKAGDDADVAHITCVPNLVAVGKVDGVAVVPT
jgi:hypothetical protein